MRTRRWMSCAGCGRRRSAVRRSRSRSSGRCRSRARSGGSDPMSSWPLYPVSVVGSWPRPSWLLEAMKRKRQDLRELQDQAALLAIKLQEDAGIDLITDGEQRRDNFYSFVCDRLEGIRLMSL